MKQKIKIVHLIASGGLYGAEKWIVALMRAMDSAAFDSVLVNLSDEPEKSSRVVEFARGKGLEALDFYTGGTFNPSSIYRLSRWLKSENVDVVHGHGYKSDLIGLVAARMAGTKMISTPHGWSKEADRKLQFYESLDRFLFRFMDHVCPLSEDLLDSVCSCTRPEKRKLILNGVDIAEVNSTQGSKESQVGYPRIGYVGQLIERKDLPTLLAAVHQVCLTKAVKLVVVGDGPDRSKLISLAKSLGCGDSVDFLGYRTDALAITKSCDIFVLPSLLEGIPRCIMEAMAASVPVIVSDIPGCRDLVEHEKTGLLFQPANSTDLADKIEYILDHPDRAAEMAAAGREKINAEYSNMRMAREYAEVYYQLVSH